VARRKRAESSGTGAPDAPASERGGVELLTVIEPDGATNGHDPELSPDELLHCYRTMLLVRAFDDTCMKLQRSGRIGFSIPNRGVEATQVGAASALERSDWIFPSYRDFGMALYHGVTPLAMMHNMYGNCEDSARGRQMPVHFSFDAPIRFVSISSPIGTHIPQAVGAARAFQHRGEPHVVLASFGDGGTSSLGFHSGLNFAGVWKSPVVFLCQNNGWAISCPSEKQTASDGYAVKAVAYGMPGVLVDGNDLLAVRKAVKDAVARARRGGGPTLIEARTFRMGGHSTSDDPTRYVPRALVEEWEKRDPVQRFERFLEKRGLWRESQREELYAAAMAEVNDAAKAAQATPPPGLETIFSDVYAELPPHLRRQGQAAFDLARRKGEAAAGEGEFPL
jgi:2-oxoisovalerate dehydrogenase E1 component alpha subunit